ncbi:MAG: FAD-binding oxidoreductase [Methylococcales bacterium]|jgi:4-cresol dehydrogenase (hydroxylating) flavoprotein subunit|nr:FAD-binding oxidoreductase [Methylococcales bacterium]MBT7408754.1 FAD-binding oxidoreductase [Methylococcales bacterium]
MAESFSNIVGKNHVISDSVALKTAETTTFATTQTIKAIVKPGDVQQIQACVKLAKQQNVSLYPISCGKNWGLGSKVPVQTDNVVLDLSRLNQISNYNEELGYFTVEPGVTFQQAYQFLLDRKSPFFSPVIGGSPQASLIGNMLERGDRIGPNLDKISGMSELEVVLANGQIIHTGLGHFQNSQATGADAWGVGPHVNGIFTQSNLGIVTKMTLHLTRKPNFFKSIYFMVDDQKKLPDLIKNIRLLIQEGAIANNTLSLWNSYKILAKMGKFPTEIIKQRMKQNPLGTIKSGLSLVLKDITGKEPWHGSCYIHAASEAIGEATQQHIQSRLAKVTDQLQFSYLNESDMKGDGLLLGEPQSDNIASLYWRKKGKLPETFDPDRDRCGAIWCCPGIPFIGDHVTKVIEHSEAMIKRYKFEPNLGFFAVTSRLLYLFIAIVYDRELENEDIKAMQCHDELLESLQKMGYFPYRLGVQSMNALPDAIDDYDDFLKQLKTALDPNNVISPGRYTK